MKDSIALRGAKVLVTGGAGFIGANLIRRLLSDECKITATLHHNPARVFGDGIDYVRADLTSMEDCRRVVEGAEYVFMCAANTSGAAIIKGNPLEHITPNIVMNAQMLEAAYLARVKKFVFISSNAAYPPTGERPVREDEMFHGDPYECYYGAGWMKRYAEILCRTYAEKLRSPMATVVVRPSNIYGPFDKFSFETSHMMAALLRRVIERHKPLIVWGSGEDVRDLIYVDDFLDGMLLAFQYPSSFFAVNIASGTAHSIRDIVDLIITVDGFADAEIHCDSSKPSTIPVRRIDITKARELLGFEPRTGLTTGIRKTIAWYKEYAIPRSEESGTDVRRS